MAEWAEGSKAKAKALALCAPSVYSLPWDVGSRLGIFQRKRWVRHSAPLRGKDTRDKSSSRGDGGTWGGCRIRVPTCRPQEALRLSFYTFSFSPVELVPWYSVFCLVFSPLGLWMT